MLLALLVLAAAAHPLDSFRHDHPASTRVEGQGGKQLVHASGFTAQMKSRDPESAAREFIGAYAGAFGVTGRQTLSLIHATPQGTVGPVRFQRRIDGLPVFGRDLIVGVDAQSRVFLVNGSEMGSDISGAHTLSDDAALERARSSMKGLEGVSDATVTRGWRSLGSSVRAAYKVEFIAQKPAGDWRVILDAETGNVLFREDTRRYASANGNIYEVSPVETAAARCSASGGGLSFCASTITATIPNLNSTASLVGTNTAVYNCKGANYPSAAGSVTTACSSINSTGSAFTAAADTTWKSLTDDFSGQMAYFHLDKHVSFFKSIDATLPPAASGGPGRVAIRNSIPALVNSYEGSQPLENAFFSGTLGAMVFGQGADADYAYDATVMYHEFTHGVVNAWGDFNLDIDSEGGLDEPGAVNEGSADSMAVSETGRSQIGSFVSSTGSSPSAFLRDLNDANNKRSCHGDGTTTNQFGATVLRGLDGEVHDDGEIWNGYFWEIYSGLKTAGLKGCGGSCEAGAAIMYKAIELAAGGGPQYSTYPSTFKSAAQALFPGNTALANYITCVGTRRGMDQCDRTTPVYSGESKAEFIRLRYGSFQPTFTTTGASSFQICSVNNTATRVHLRKGSKVALSNIQSNGSATVTEDSHVDIQTSCPTGQTVTLPSAGTWYVLLDSPNALSGGTPGYDIYLLKASSTGMASRPAAAAPGTCSYVVAGGPLTVTPATKTVAPGETITFTGSGGTGTGFTWAISTNDSGGTINSTTGVYKAGATGNVSDVITLTDSASSSTTATITVTASLSISPNELNITPGGTETFSASGGSGTGYTFTLVSAGSGGHITSAGAYTAGITDPSTDTVKVTDSLGNTATATVNVSSSGGGDSGGGCGTFGVSGALMLLGLVPLFLRQRKLALARARANR